MHGLDDEYEEKLAVNLINIDDPANYPLMERYGAESVPMIVILNDRGEVSNIFYGLTSTRELRAAIDQALQE